MRKHQERLIDMNQIRKADAHFSGSFPASVHKSFLKYVCLTLCLLCVMPVQSAQRVALVIGNAHYQHAPGLANPLNDARDIHDAFERLGFSVTLVTNSDSNSLRRTLRDFKRAASASSIAVIFYAGHGIEIDNRNFLVPVDAKLASDEDVEYETVPLELVSGAVKGASELRLVILDACRDNPFIASMRHTGATRSIGRGLARIEPSGETLVAYAAKGGTVALDGEGRNSPFTKALLAHVEQPGLEVGLMFRQIRDAVLADTGGRQEPFVYGSLSAKGAYLTSQPELQETVSVSVPPATTVESRDQVNKQLEVVFWNSIKDGDNVDEYQAYLETYPQGSFVALARSRLKRLKEAEAVGTEVEIKEGQKESVPTLSLSRSESRLIQFGLAKLGFKPGPIDGLFGDQTRQAIASWQEVGGHEKTGQLLQDQAAALMAIGEQAKAEMEKEAEAERKKNQMIPGQAFRDCTDCPLMVVIPDGSFTMGSPVGEEDRFDDEGPQHRVSIKKFAVGVNEVTRGEFRRFISATGHLTSNSCWVIENGEWEDRSGKNWSYHGFSQTDNHPVVCVNWNDAKAYVAWLSRKTGHQYRLLSESEWEYVARARSHRTRFWGEGETSQCRYANGADRAYKDRYPNWAWATVSCRDGAVHTAVVGNYEPNGFGLHDVLGNVWEWVEDCWHESYAGTPEDGRAWTWGGDCEKRVLRGGSWDNGPWNLRSANRDWDSVEGRTIVSGFRIARTLSP